MTIDSELASENAKKLFETITDDKFDIKLLYEDEHLYYAFISVFGRYTVKDTLFRANTQDNIADIESWYNPKDEALALLLLENGIQRWIKKLELKKKRNKLIWLVKLTNEDNKTLPPYRYTQCSVGEGENGKHKNDGWGLKGITRYAELVKECEHFRTTTQFTTFTSNLLSNLRSPTLSQSQYRLKRRRDAQSEIGSAEKLQKLFERPELKVNFGPSTPIPTDSHENMYNPVGDEPDGQV